MSKPARRKTANGACVRSSSRIDRQPCVLFIKRLRNNCLIIPTSSWTAKVFLPSRNERTALKLFFFTDCFAHTCEVRASDHKAARVDLESLKFKIPGAVVILPVCLSLLFAVARYRSVPPLRARTRRVQG